MTLQNRLDAARLWLEGRPSWARLLAPFAAGSVTVLAMPPWSVWAALWPGFSAFYILLGWARTKKQAFWCGWMFGFGFFMFGLSWIANALTVDGSTYSWIIPVAICGLPALLAIFTGGAALAASRLGDLRRLTGMAGFAGLLTLSEWLRGHVMSGFPWNLFGYGWSGVAEIEQTVSLGGIYALTFFTILWGALPGFLAAWPANRMNKAICALTVYALLGGAFAWGHARLAANPTAYNGNYVLRVVQPSIPQSLKWDRQKTVDSFRQTVKAALANGYKPPPGAAPDATILMIWPETAVEQGVMQDPEAQAVLRHVFSEYPDNFYLATGLLRWDNRTDRTYYYNSIGLYDNQLNLLETYDKGHLVPFGEYVPLSRWLPANPLVSADGFEHGPGAAAMAIPPAARDPFQVSPMICYEVIFPGAIVRKGTHPGLLLNVTNDGWYGDSAGPRQHLAISRFRAIEEGIPMARAANTGISAVIDAYGRILWRTKIFEITTGNIILPKTAVKTTLYSKYGDSIALVFAFFACCAAVTGRNRRRT